VQVVPAGVHDRDGFAGRVLGGDAAGERQAGLFLHRQRVELGAQHDGRPRAVAQQCDHAGAADAGGHVKAERLGFGGQLGGGFALVEGQLGMLVQVVVQRQDRRVGGVGLVGEGLGQAGLGGGAGGGDD
jgi:hypothetical protein